jgi:hypothetical protein
MKNAIYNLLKNGYYNGRKYTIDDMCKKLYFLKYIARADEVLQVRTKSNSFWEYTNNDKRIELLHDLFRVHQFKITDNAYFHIINRFENGDGYGIVREV